MGKINKKITRKLSKKFANTSNSFKCEPINGKSDEVIPEKKVSPQPEQIQPNKNEDNAKEGKKLRVQNKKKFKAEKKESPQPEPTELNKNEDNTNEDKKLGVQNKKKFKAKKKVGFYEKCAKARTEKGMIILPQKIETKIYKLKKALRKKGLDDNEIKDIIRKKRREEELKLRKEQKTLCYKCRQPGHSLANCPQANGDEQSAVDICYFCGSAEHKLSECSKYKSAGKKKQNLPYATCFICKKSGHLTSSCTDNENGVYPKGGKCIICGSVKHLVKDCAQNKDKDKPEEEIILKTYNDISQSVDADDFEIIPKNIKGKGVPKMVKF